MRGEDDDDDDDTKQPPRFQAAGESCCDSWLLVSQPTEGRRGASGFS